MTTKTDKSLKDKAIDFKGKDYVEVYQRILWLDENERGNYSITTELLNQIPAVKTNKTVWVVKATLKIGDNVYTGLSQEIEGSSYINNTSALENAETSAVGRACAMAGIGVIDGIASIDEINKANNNSETTITRESSNGF